MRIAIIDLGTNSVRFDVHQISPRGKATTLYREKIMVRLGQGVFIRGKLDPAAIKRTVHAFSIFAKQVRGLHVDRVVALGTSALREAADARKLIDSIRIQTGIELRVISGTAEAQLITLGILANENIPRDTFGLIDIGGGSTEISICQGWKTLYANSFQLGTSRLQQMYLKSSPPDPESIERMRKHVRAALSEVVTRKHWPKVDEMIGSSGTVKALAKMIRKLEQKKEIEPKDLSRLIKDMSTMTTTQLLGLPGVEAKRVDMILAGAILLEECMWKFNVESLRPTDYSLRDGILQEQMELSAKHMNSRIVFHLPDLYEKALKFGQDEKALRAQVDLADKLFKRLARIHKLEREWRLYLQAAVLFRRSGEAINLIGHANHSYYIFRNAGLPFLDARESEFIAQLCLNHERQKVDFEQDKIKDNRFVKLLAILGIVDALDTGRDPQTVLDRVRISKKEVQITISGGPGAEIGKFRAEQRRPLFEKAFGRALTFKTVG